MCGERDSIRWRCPKCHSLLDEGEGLFCAQCGKAPRIEGRFVDFSPLAPRLDIGLSSVLQDVNERIASMYPDLTDDPRVRRTLRRIGERAEGGLCLEIGCANGPMTPSLEDMFDNVVAVEHAESMIRRTVERTRAATCVLAEAHHLPLGDDSADFVVCTEVLEHMVIPTQGMLEIRRVLKAQGLAVLSVPNWRPFDFLRVVHGKVRIGDTHVNFFDNKSFSYLLARCGFDVVDMRTWERSMNLRTILRRPWHLLRKLPALGTLVECFARPAANPLACWDDFVARMQRADMSV